MCIRNCILYLKIKEKLLHRTQDRRNKPEQKCEKKDRTELTSTHLHRINVLMVVWLNVRIKVTEFLIVLLYTK